MYAAARVINRIRNWFQSLLTRDLFERLFLFINSKAPLLSIGPSRLYHG